MKVRPSGLNYRRIMKKKDYLKGINYELYQEDDRYKVNSDTVALGMFLDPMKNKSILDIGTNNGALLMYAHARGAKQLTGVDIHADALALAKENLSMYTTDYCLLCNRVQDLQAEPFDVIVCNPPFFEMNNVTPDPYFKEAMFENSLPLEDLFSCFRRLLKENGEIYLIYQADRFPELYQMCIDHKLKIMKMQFVHDISSDYALRVLLKLKIGKMSKCRILAPLLLDKGEFIDLKRNRDI